MKKVFIYSELPTKLCWVEAFIFDTFCIFDTHTRFYLKGNTLGQIPHSMAFKIEEI